ncbi:CDP-diacylglycerol--serine O-phosphatidyltransferase, partial [Klebsiella pneumoniae]
TPSLSSTSFKKFIDDALLQSDAIHLLNTPNRTKTAEFKHLIKQFRLGLRGASYQFSGNASNDELSVTPFV